MQLSPNDHFGTCVTSALWHFLRVEAPTNEDTQLLSVNGHMDVVIDEGKLETGDDTVVGVISVVGSAKWFLIEIVDTGGCGVFTVAGFVG